MSRFLNRILGLEVELQNCSFAYFTESRSVVVQQAKRSERCDEGILGKGRYYLSLNVVCTRNCHFSSWFVSKEESVIAFAKLFFCGYSFAVDGRVPFGV